MDNIILQDDCLLFKDFDGTGKRIAIPGAKGGDPCFLAPDLFQDVFRAISRAGSNGFIILESSLLYMPGFLIQLTRFCQQAGFHVSTVPSLLIRHLRLSAGRYCCINIGATQTCIENIEVRYDGSYSINNRQVNPTATLMQRIFHQLKDDLLVGVSMDELTELLFDYKHTTVVNRYYMSNAPKTRNADGANDRIAEASYPCSRVFEADARLSCIVDIVARSTSQFVSEFSEGRSNVVLKSPFNYFLPVHKILTSSMTIKLVNDMDLLNYTGPFPTGVLIPRCVRRYTTGLNEPPAEIPCTNPGIRLPVWRGPLLEHMERNSYQVGSRWCVNFLLTVEEDCHKNFHVTLTTDDDQQIFQLIQRK